MARMPKTLVDMAEVAGGERLLLTLPEARKAVRALRVDYPDIRLEDFPRLYLERGNIYRDDWGNRYVVNRAGPAYEEEEVYGLPHLLRRKSLRYTPLWKSLC